MARKQSRRITSRRGSGKGKSGASTKTQSSAKSIAHLGSATKLARSRRSVPTWTIRRFEALTPKQQDTYFRAKGVINEARSGESPSRAAREAKMSLATVLRYFPGDFIKKKSARQYSVSASDKHVNQVQRIGENGYETFLLRGSKEASRQGTYLNDVKKALRRDVSALHKWHDKKIGGRVLITDVEKLKQLAREGKLDFEDEVLWRS
jgi:hypothetical protein